jgi:ferredoxin-NADP reductase
MQDRDRTLMMGTVPMRDDGREYMDLVVTGIVAETPQVRSVELGPQSGSLPSWTAGSHVKIRLPSGETRSYSLVNSRPDDAVIANPRSYRLGVRLEENSKGGSRYIHALRVGDRVQVSKPENRFPLETHGKRLLLIAGGIGITPLLSMAATLRARDIAFDMIYAGRSRDQLAFLAELESLCRGNLTVHGDDQSGLLDMPAILARLAEDRPVYVCGPKPMIEAAIGYARDHGWPKERLNFEIFAEQAAAEGDAAFEVTLSPSGRRIPVAADQTILAALLAAGEDILFDCERGDCGMCQARVLEGIPDHRDYYLSEAERQSNKVIQTCVSRSRTPVLVLELAA